MIRIINDTFDRLDEVKKICKNDPFGIRILSYLETYDLSLDFIDIWYQEDKHGKIIALISRFEDRYTIFSKYTRNNKKLLEIQEFISFRNAKTVMMDFKLRIDFSNIKSVIMGDVLKFDKKNAKYKEDNLFRPNVDAYYEILTKNKSDTFLVPEYMYFLSDVTYRKNRERVALFGYKHDDKLASVCMSVSESDDGVILGAVATDPDYQGRGYCKKLVNAAASIYSLYGKNIFIFSRMDSTTKLYKKAGFRKKFYFIEYFLE